MLNISSVSSEYLTISLFIAIYQGIRGVVFQLVQSKKYDLYKDFGIITRIFMFCVADFIFYFVTTLFGFASLLIVKNIICSISKLQDIGTGVSAIIIFLVLIGIFGICGQLPYLIQHGKLPWHNINAT